MGMAARSMGLSMAEAASAPANASAPQVAATGIILMLSMFAIIVPEVVLSGSDLGLWGDPRWRELAYLDGAFWPAILHGTMAPLHEAQAWTMVLSYGVLHTGPLHVAANAVTLASLGRAVLRQLGATGFLAVWIAALIGGALAQALIGAGDRPVVGASGALFGLLAALLVARPGPDGVSLSRSAALARSMATHGLAIVGPNLAMVLLLQGEVAWETHVGGYVAGGAVAMTLHAAHRRRVGP